MVHQRESPLAGCPRIRKDHATSPSTCSSTARRGRLNSSGSRSPTLSATSPRTSMQPSNKASFLSPTSRAGNGQHLRSSLCIGAKGSASSSSSTNRHCSPQRSACCARVEVFLLPRVGARVAIASGAQGFVRFTGQTQFKPGLWAGVELDDALGKGDGSVQGHTYFRCSPLHGIFVMPSTLQMLGDSADASRDVSTGMNATLKECFTEVVVMNATCSPKQLATASEPIQCDRPKDDGICDTNVCSRSQAQTSTLEEETSAIFQSDMPLRSSTCGDQHAKGISLADHSTELSPGRPDDDDSEGDPTALHEMYGADWCNPTLYSSQKKKSAKNDCIDKTPEKEVEISDIAERLSFSGCHRNTAAATVNEETKIRLDQERYVAEGSMADDHRLLYTAMEGLRMAAETAIARAETAEAKLAAQAPSLASPQDVDLQKTLAEEVKVVIAAEVKKAVRVAVDEATSELRAVVAEARQLRDSVKPSADMIGDFHAALALTQGSKLERNKLDIHGEDDRDRESVVEGREALMMMAMKAIAHQVLESGSKSYRVSPSISTDDAQSSATLAGASRAPSLYSSVSCSSSRASSVGGSPSRGEKPNDVVEVKGSARLVPAHEDSLLGSPEILKEAPLPMTPTTSTESLAEEEAPMRDSQVGEQSPSSMAKSDRSRSPQRSASTPGLLANYLGPQESRSVRDVVSQFERILPGRGRHQQEGPLAPWPFAPVTRSKNFSIAATPWTTSLSSVPRRPARTASLSALH